MEKKSIQKILSGTCLLFVSITLQAQVVLKHWTVEDHSDKMRIEVARDTLDITAPKGFTLWYNQRLTGNYEINYSVKVLMQGGKNERLSDLNCFWGANDPKYPNDLYVRSAWRKGFFPNYNSFDLFYVGYGGNYNSTTRFRRYFGGTYSMDDSRVRPLIKEYTDYGHLLKANKWYRICICVKNGTTTYSVDGEELFRYDIKPGECDGQFGLRLLENHVLFTDFHTEKL